MADRAGWTYILGMPKKSTSVQIGIIILLVVGLMSCNKKQVGFDSGIPMMHTKLKVESVEERAGYLEANLLLNDRQLSTFTLPSEECRQVFVPGEKVSYVDSGPLGSFKREDFRCQSMGKGNLTVWRDRTRRSSREPLPRAQANYRVLESDDEATYLRGSFPLAGRAGFSNSADIVARIPSSGQCKKIIERSTASMEYRSKGNMAYVLVGKTGVCEIDGFALPISEKQAAAARGED